MNFYLCTDDPCGCCLSWEEKTVEMVWAGSEAEALSVYADHYRYTHGISVDELPERPAARLHEAPAGFVPATPNAHVEQRPALLRQLGWSVEGEERCEVCDMAAMDADEFEVCPECLRCRPCGHEESCPARE